MISTNWKILVLVPVTVFLAACQHGSDDPQSSASSPYQGLWVSNQSQLQLSECHRLQGRFQAAPTVDTIGIQGDGQVFRYANREVWANHNARKAWRIGSITGNGEFQRGSNMTVGTFRIEGGNRMVLVNMQGAEQETYLRTTEAQLQSFAGEMHRCMNQGRAPGWGQPQAQPPQAQPPQVWPPQQRPPVPGERGWDQQREPQQHGQWAQTPPPQRQTPIWQQPMPQQQEAYPPGYGH